MKKTSYDERMNCKSSIVKPVWQYLFNIKIKLLREHSDAFQILYCIRYDTLFNQVSGIVAPDTTFIRYNTFQKEGNRSFTWIFRILSHVKHITTCIYRDTPPPWYKSSLQWKEIREKFITIEHLDSITPCNWNSQWIWSVIADSLLQNPGRINIHSFKKMFYFIFE